MPAKVDRTALFGKSFGRWTVLGEIGSRRWKADRQAWSPEWRLACRCQCGTLGAVPPNDLARGHSTSCGCYAAEAIGERQTVHGHTKGRKITPEFASWKSMKQRCLDPNDIGYKNYGGAGIKIFEPWISSFDSFLEYVGPMPAPRMTIDRIENHLGYQPGNVRWATRKQQARNKNSNHLVEFAGVLMPIAQASEASGVRQSTIRQRISYGWPAEDLLKPVGYKRQ